MTIKLVYPIAFIAFCSASAFAKQPAEFSVTATNIYNGASEFKNDNTELKRDTWMLSADSNFQLAQRWKLGFSFGYENENFDWDIALPTLPISTAIAPWDKVKTVKASVTLSHILDRNWILSATPIIQSSYVDGLSMSDAHSYGIVTSGLYRFESGNMVGVGVAYTNDLNRVRTTPYLAINWKINDNWKLGNPFKSDFSGPAGLELSYQLNRDVSFGIGGTLKRDRFLVNGEDISAEIEETVTFIRASWDITPQFIASVYAGYNSNGTLEYSHNLGKFDLEGHSAGALSLTYKF
ncbi:hypothetical protein SOPP22_08405 [Shewanella sp. OPT22]|nr:hypothetical protein SOPP22_08405 [Shewanella sp. OPT22]